MDIKREYKTRKKRQLMLAIPMFVIFIPLLLAGEKAKVVLGVPVAYYGIFTLIVVIGALIFSLKNWRCPACDRYFGKSMNHRFCPGCGVELQ